MPSQASESLLLIQIKLHHPLVPNDQVHRPRLTEWLEHRHQRPLTLVSAFAGYGRARSYPIGWRIL
jgi:ATP/maltotriose-dependent transcriptional regulator MalT